MPAECQELAYVTALALARVIRDSPPWSAPHVSFMENLTRSLVRRQSVGPAKVPKSLLSSCSSFITRLAEAAVLEGHHGACQCVVRVSLTRVQAV